MIKKTFLTILFIVISLFLFPAKASAADYNLSLTPPLLRVHIKPGKSISQVFTINNQSKTDKILVARLVPFTAADDLGNPVINPKNTADWLGYFSLANSRIRLNEPFTITAGSTEQIVLSLSIPNTAPLEDLYATLMISTYSNSLNKDLQGSNVTATIGSNILVTISSSAFPDTVLKIDSFQPQKGSLIKIGNLYFADSLTPLTFTALVHNDGSFLAETKGVFRVTTSRGNPVYLEGILPVNVLGKSQRRLVNSNGQAFTFTPSLSQIGSHQISLEIHTDNSNTTNSITIFFFPMKLTLGLILVLLVIFVLSQLTTHSLKHGSIDIPS